MSDPNILEFIARHRTERVLALIAASGQNTDDMEDDVYRLYLAMEHLKDERAKAGSNSPPPTSQDADCN